MTNKEKQEMFEKWLESQGNETTTSKPAPHVEHVMTCEYKRDGVSVGIITVTEKEFKTGSRGFFGVGKVGFGSKRFQCQTQMVEIGSKPQPK
jgi:hypothetical protein